jgi:hypothetical protein
LSDFNETSIFFDRVSKNNQISNFMKIHPVEAELFHADRRTDGWTYMRKLKVTFRNFANVPKNGFKKRYQTRDNFVKDKKWYLLAESHTNWNGGGIASASY